MQEDPTIPNWARQSTAAWQRAYDQYTRWMQNGMKPGAAMQNEYVRFMTEETARYANEVMKAGIQYYNSVYQLSNAYYTQLGRIMYGDMRSPAPPLQHTPLELRGRLGEVATRSFVLENKNTAPKDIYFLVSDFSSDTGEPFRPTLLIRPSRFVIHPGEEQTVHLELSLDKDLFSEGELYRATIAVQGYGGLTLDIEVRVD